jgi:hypothetical protein
MNGKVVAGALLSMIFSIATAEARGPYGSIYRKLERRRFHHRPDRYVLALRSGSELRQRHLFHGHD